MVTLNNIVFLDFNSSCKHVRGGCPGDEGLLDLAKNSTKRKKTSPNYGKIKVVRNEMV